MGVVAWNELAENVQLADAIWIPLFGLPAFFASMARLSKHLEPVFPHNTDGQPRWAVGELAAFVFFIPGGALCLALSVLRTTRDSHQVASNLLWLGWALSCTGMQAL